ncbi:hypothetical protein OESDEN_08211 [Oesophagostomum dentatum]|uniref:Uncharacterized protein n=1 Tax=Oesophagostomum dentatum TaxID=61180 RepID=A0A0B1T2W0_OESDE|nr:hypothetical protein OESDEN_08211 [Oesophagostomum dentatum]
MDLDDREEVHRCSKTASTVPDHAKCLVKVLDKTKHIKKVKVVKDKPTNHVKHKQLKLAATTEKPKSRGKYRQVKITMEKPQSKVVERPDERDWIGGFRMARAKRSAPQIINRSSYTIPSIDDDTIFAKVARQMTKTVRKLKNKEGLESWRSAVQRIKKVGADAREVKNRRKELKKKLRQMIANTPEEFQDPRKPLAMKEMDLQDEKTLKEKKVIKKKRDEIRIPMKIVRDSIKVPSSDIFFPSA